MSTWIADKLAVLPDLPPLVSTILGGAAADRREERKAHVKLGRAAPVS